MTAAVLTPLLVPGRISHSDCISLQGLSNRGPQTGAVITEIYSLEAGTSRSKC